MPNYTITPSFLEYAKNNPSNIFDVLMVFVPDNSKKICLDTDNKLFLEYQKVIEGNKELTDWLSYLSIRKESSFVKIVEDKCIENLPLGICKESFDRLLITEDESNFAKFKKELSNYEIILLNDSMAKVHLNYSNLGFNPSKYLTITSENLLLIIEEICDEFKRLIELNGIYKLLYTEKSRVLEKSLQLIFFSVAFSYCKANNLKISPEVNSGNGPVDFNFSQGFTANINVELKFADNSKLENGLNFQLESYNQAERSCESIYLVVFTKDSELKKVAKLKEILERKEKLQKVPILKIIDARKKIPQALYHLN